MAEPYQLPIATVFDVALSFGVATTTVELDRESYLSYPIAPATLWALDSDVSVFDFHQLVHRDDRRLVFESYEVQAVALPVGANYRFCSWWTPQAIAAIRDLAAKWELRPYPGNDHSHCLLTWARISAKDEETEGYYNSEHGWITKTAFRESFDEDRLHIRRAWQSIEYDWRAGSMVTIEAFKQIEPTKDALFDIAFRRVDDSMLREIANADYGMDADAHLQALLAIKAGQIPAPMKWEPKEVLELTRWSEPEDPTSEPGSVGERQHWMRLLSCAILIRAAAEPENEGHFDGEASTIMQLVDSAMKLGEETSVATLRFLCWRMEYRRLEEWNRPYFAVGILLLVVLLNKCDSQTAQYLIAAANSEVVAFAQLFDDCLVSQKWKEATRRILCESITAGEDVRRFGTLLLGRTNAGW